MQSSLEILRDPSLRLLVPDFAERRKERKKRRKNGRNEDWIVPFFFFPKFEILRNKWKAKKNFEESKKPSKNVLKNNNSIRDSSKGFILGGFRTLFLKG